MQLVPQSLVFSALAATACIQLTSCAGSQTSPAGGVPVEVNSPEPQASVVEDQSPSGAETFYQQLLSQYGEDCTECLQPIKVQLQSSGFSDTDEPRAQLNVLIALDSSGSMAESVTGGTKMDIAKTAVARFVGDLPNAANVGLLVYGHKGSNRKADQAISCAGIETVYPISPLDQSKFMAAVNSVQPTGYTPIAAALQKAEQAIALSKTSNSQNVVFMVSDGIETCNGNPVSVAQRLHNSETKVIVNVVGFDVDNEAQRQLQAVAEAGGGKYFSARSAAELNQIFDQSKTLSELNRYRATSLQNRSRVAAVLTGESNRLSACIFQKQNQERANMMMALNRIPPDDPNHQYRSYVMERLGDRHQKTTAWNKRLQKDLLNRRDVTIDQLEQELQQVTSRVSSN